MTNLTPLPGTIEVPGPLYFPAPPARFSIEASGKGDGFYTVRGHAAVFNRPSHDMGGFRFQIAPGAFAGALATRPDVHLVIGHNMDLVLARTTNGTLKLAEDGHGLTMWARIDGNVSYAADLRRQMENGNVDQMSFAGFIGDTDWSEHDGEAVCTITNFSEVVDATICAQGAFPQTQVKIAASRFFEQAAAAGHVPETVRAARRGGHGAGAGLQAVTTDDPSGGDALPAHALATVRAAKVKALAALSKEHTS